jgi:hypothetical protein
MFVIHCVFCIRGAVDVWEGFASQTEQVNSRVLENVDSYVHRIGTFFLDEATGELRMQLVPTLPRWLLETKVEDGLKQTPKFSFKLFSSIQVYCYNERSVDLFGVLASRYRVGLRDGSTFVVDEASIPFELADKIRRVIFVDFIEAFF